MGEIQNYCEDPLRFMCLKYFVNSETPRQMSTLMILENTSLHAVNYSHPLKISGRTYNILLGLQILSEEGFQHVQAAPVFSLGAPGRSIAGEVMRRPWWALGGRQGHNVNPGAA